MLPTSESTLIHARHRTSRLVSQVTATNSGICDLPTVACRVEDTGETVVVILGERPVDVGTVTGLHKAQGLQVHTVTDGLML